IRCVASPEGRHRGPCESQQTIEEGTRPVKTLWRGNWRGSPSPAAFTENGTDPGNFCEVFDGVAFKTNVQPTRSSPPERPPGPPAGTHHHRPYPGLPESPPAPRAGARQA